MTAATESENTHGRRAFLIAVAALVAVTLLILMVLSAYSWTARRELLDASNQVHVGMPRSEVEILFSALERDNTRFFPLGGGNRHPTRRVVYSHPKRGGMQAWEHVTIGFDLLGRVSDVQVTLDP